MMGTGRIELILEALLMLTCPGSHQAVLGKGCTDYICKPGPKLPLLWVPALGLKVGGSSNPSSIHGGLGPLRTVRHLHWKPHIRRGALTSVTEALVHHLDPRP